MSGSRTELIRQARQEDMGLWYLIGHARQPREHGIFCEMCFKIPDMIAIGDLETCQVTTPLPVREDWVCRGGSGTFRRHLTCSGSFTRQLAQAPRAERGALPVAPVVRNGGAGLSVASPTLVNWPTGTSRPARCYETRDAWRYPAAFCGD